MSVTRLAQTVLRKALGVSRFSATSTTFQRHSPYISRHVRYQTAAAGKPFHDSNPSAVKAEKMIRSLERRPTSSDPVVIKAAELVKKAVSEGSTRGKTILASMYREGLGVDKDVDTAFCLFEEASKSGDPVAQCSLGDLTLNTLKEEDDHHRLTPSDLRIAVDEHGEQKAAHVEFVKPDGTTASDRTTPSELVRRVRKARRKAGFSDSQALAYEHHRGEEEEKAMQEARAVAHNWLECSIDQGFDQAMVVLANDIFTNHPERAVELYERAGKSAQNTDAYFNLGQIYENGAEGISPDFKKSFKCYGLSAQFGDPAGQVYMAHLYRNGSPEVDANEKLAVEYMEMAVQQHHPPALYFWAVMHLNGECGLYKDVDLFRATMKESAELEFPPALACLGDMYYKGTEGTEMDYEKALDCFTRAGHLGESDAMCSAAAMHFRGLGTKVNEHEAFMLYQEAALHDSVPALRNIASMYFYGQGVPTNKKMAEHFMQVADTTEQNQRDEKLKGADQTIRTTPVPAHSMPPQPPPGLQ